MNIPEELKQPQVRLSPACGIGHEPGVRRQDPSNVVRLPQGGYAVWYSRVTPEINADLLPVFGEIWWATSDDGVHWQERGAALRPRENGKWDAAGVLTPFVLPIDDRWVLYYTAMMPPYERESPAKARWGIGVAVAAAPQCPWQHVGDGPVLPPTPHTWDSQHVDDANVFVRNGKVWLYYKGFATPGAGFAPHEGPQHSRWGVATADAPEGPFHKHPEPVLDSGHTTLLWPHRDGVGAIVDHVGPEAHTVQWSGDGVHFQRAASLEIPIREGGAYCPELTTDSGSSGIRWGICVDVTKRPEACLQRFDVALSPESAQP